MLVRDKMTREYYSGLIEEFVDSSVEAVLGALTDSNQFSLELTPTSGVGS